MRIRRRDGQVFVVRSEPRPDASPLYVAAVDLGVSAQEIVAAVREGRERYG